MYLLAGQILLYTIYLLREKYYSGFNFIFNKSYSTNASIFFFIYKKNNLKLHWNFEPNKNLTNKFLKVVKIMTMNAKKIIIELTPSLASKAFLLIKINTNEMVTLSSFLTTNNFQYNWLHNHISCLIRLTFSPQITPYTLMTS